MKNKALITSITTKIRFPKAAIEKEMNSGFGEEYYSYTLQDLEIDLLTVDHEPVVPCSAETLIKGKLELAYVNLKDHRLGSVEAEVTHGFLVTCMKTRNGNYKLACWSSMS
ncbi:MAG: hypothetical protein ACM3VS_12440 [Candidatus Dadabacteria bacterium]